MIFESVFEELDWAYAQNTLRAYRNDLNRFIDWLMTHDQDPTEASHLDLIHYLENGCHTLCSASIQRTVAAIGTIYHYAELNDPTKHPKVKLTLRKLNRTKGNLQKQARPLTQGLLSKLLEHCDLNTVRGLRDAVLLNLGYETMRRRSELVNFRFDDLRISASGENGILLRHSKTDQNGHGRVIPISHKLTDQLDKWQLRVQDSGYILRNINRAEAIGEKLSGESINRILKRLEKEAGSQDSKLSGHSFRVGRTIELVGSGCSTAQIALLGGWKSEKIVMRYSEAWAHKSG
ncbi:site-specific integrase [Litoricolaceae bacterium]|nr:site-specific integrase [Litorivicinaceae bacterium]